MPEYHNAFLDAYFASNARALEEAKQSQDADEFQKRLQFQQATQQQEFGLKAQQFAETQRQNAAENVFRQQQLDAAAQAHSDAMMQHNQQLAETLFKLPGASIAPVTSAIPRQDTLPATQAPEGLPQLPGQQISVQTVNPVPEGSQVVPTSIIPGGTQSLPAGLELQQKTPAQMELEKKNADTEAAKATWRVLTPEAYAMAPKTYDTLGYKAGDKIDPKHDEQITKFLLSPQDELAKGLDAWKAHYTAQARELGRPLNDKELDALDQKMAVNKETPDTVMARYFANDAAATAKAAGISGAANVIAAPESYNYTGKEKTYVDNELANQGYAPPNLKDTALRSQDAAAKQVVGIINGDATGIGLKQTLQNKDVLANIGPFAGKGVDFMLQEVGKMPASAIRITPETAAAYKGNPAGLAAYKQDVVNRLGYLASQFSSLRLIKAKEQMPGRLIGSLVDQNGKVSPSLGKDPDLIQAQLDAMLDVSRQVQLSYRKSMGKGWDTEPNFVASLPNTLEEVTKQGKQLTKEDIDNSPFAKHPAYVPFTVGNKRYIIKERITSVGGRAQEGPMTVYEYR